MTGDAPKFRVYIKENGSWKRIAETYDNYYVHKGAKSGSNTYTVRGVSKDGKKFTTMFNPTGVTYRYKTSDKTRDAYINYMMNHQSEWMPSLGSNHNLSGVMFWILTLTEFRNLLHKRLIPMSIVSIPLFTNLKTVS